MARIHDALTVSDPYDAFRQFIEDRSIAAVNACVRLSGFLYC